MSQPLIHELWRLCLLVIATTTIALFFSSAIVGVTIGLLLYLLQLMQRYKKFYHWLNQGLGEPDDFGGIFDELAFKIYRIRNRSQKRKKKLTELLRRWQNSASALPDAAVVLNQENIIVWFNTTASSILNLKTRDQGQHIGNLLREPRFIHYLNHAKEDEQLEITSHHHDNKVFNIRLAPYGNGQRLMLVTDVTHIQQLMNMRRDFIANVSHELRTPLTVIMGYLETIHNDDALDIETIKNCLSRVEAPAHRMKSLVDDLLLLSRLDTSNEDQVKDASNIKVHPILKNIFTEAQQLSNGKQKITLNLNAESEQDHVYIKGNEKEIHSVFYNFMTNALRYTPENGEIIISWFVDEKGGHFSVKDSGVGISAQHIPRLTERFYRVDVGRSRSNGGTGLGLAIVKQVLRRHQALLHIKSVLGKGSEFGCTFPSKRISIIQKKEVAQHKA